MSITVNEIQTNLNTYLGDASTDRVSAAERLQAITEAVVWLQEELQNDHQIDTYNLNYYDTLTEYKVTSAIADLLQGADLRRSEKFQYHTFAQRDSREIAEEIGQHFGESAFAIERRNGQSYLKINHTSRYLASGLSDFEALTDGGGTWLVDAVNSDATNLAVDTVEYIHGNASLSFDLSVSQSGNNKGTIYNSTLTNLDLTQFNGLGSFVMAVYIPDVTYVTSATLFWGSSTTAYWSNTVTTDFQGNAFVNGWNTVKFDWTTATMTSTPVVTTVTYIRFDINYSSSQANLTKFRVDYLRVVRPEVLTFYYSSWSVGTNSGGTKIYAFTATTDIPYFSGQYDQYKFAVAHKAASNLYLSPLRLITQSQAEQGQADDQLKRVRKIVPKSATQPVKSFKVNGVSFRRRDTQRNRRRLS